MSSRASDGKAEPRIPPHDLDAERALLGSMLLSADAIRGAAGVRRQHFYAPIHGVIYEAIVDLYLEDVLVDLVVLAGRLGDQLDDHGGKQLLVELGAETPASANASAYAARVRRCARHRAVIAATGEIAEHAYQGSDEWNTALAELNDVAAGDSISTLGEIDLAALVDGDIPAVLPVWLHREDGQALIYPGRTHDIHASPSEGKSWLALLAVAEVLTAGGNAMTVDYEDNAESHLERLRALGVDDNVIADSTRLRYCSPTGPLGPALATLRSIVVDLAPDLVVIDGVAPALAAEGHNELDNSDVTAWGVRVPKMLAELGPGVLMLDHVVKDPKEKVRGPRGAGAKLGLTSGASYELRPVKPFSRRRAGEVAIVIAKDRIGRVGAVGETIAHATFTPHDDGAELEIKLTLPAAKDDSKPFAPTGLMERLSRALEGRIPTNHGDALDLIPGRLQYRREALKALVAGDYLTREKVGKETLYTSVRAYREGNDGPTTVQAAFLDIESTPNGSEPHDSPTTVPNPGTLENPRSPGETP